MKILVVGPNLNVIGGISNFLQGLIGFLNKNRVVNTYFDTYEAKNRRSQKSSKFSFSELFGAFFVFLNFISILRKEKYDTVILNTSSYWGFYEKSLMLFILKFFRINSVLIVHGADFRLFYDKSKVKFIIRRVLSYPNRTVFVSKEHFEYFKFELGEDKAFHINVPVIIPQEKQTLVSAELDALINYIDKYDKVYLSLSVLEPRKNVTTILKAFLDLNIEGACLLVAGDGPEKSHIKNICKTNESVYFLGPVRGTIKNYVLNNSDFMICFSDRESYGITFIEAMLCETILISSPTGVLGEFSEEQHYIPVCEHKISNLKQSLITASRLPRDESLEMKKLAFTHAQNYTWKSIGPKLLEIFSV